LFIRLLNALISHGTVLAAFETAAVIMYLQGELILRLLAVASMVRLQGHHSGCCGVAMCALLIDPLAIRVQKTCVFGIGDGIDERHQLRLHIGIDVSEGEEA